MKKDWWRIIQSTRHINSRLREVSNRNTEVLDGYIMRHLQVSLTAASLPQLDKKIPVEGGYYKRLKLVFLSILRLTDV